MKQRLHLRLFSQKAVEEQSFGWGGGQWTCDSQEPSCSGHSGGRGAVHPLALSPSQASAQGSLSHGSDPSDLGPWGTSRLGCCHSRFIYHASSQRNLRIPQSGSFRCSKSKSVSALNSHVNKQVIQHHSKKVTHITSNYGWTMDGWLLFSG